jgi:hypothetical protein
MLTTHPLLVLRLRKSKSHTSSHPNAPLRSIMGALYLYPLQTQYRRKGEKENNAKHVIIMTTYQLKKGVQHYLNCCVH